MMERFQQALRSARAVLGPSATDEEVQRYAKHLYARMLSDGHTIGCVNGESVVDRPPRKRPRLPG
ncbi:MAG: hypothetical protein IBX71_08325 [Candidatus Desulforudis sp.]|nr:hypothetical protein [Desulforudis sp.]